jgi:hypothetical protein
MVVQQYVPHMSQQLQAERMSVERQTLAIAKVSVWFVPCASEILRGVVATAIAAQVGRSRTYVWFSPLGLANHATALKTTMKMMLMRRLQLCLAQTSVML